MKTVALVAMLLICEAADAAEWRLVAESKDGRSVLVDTESIRVSDKIRRAWAKTIYPPYEEKTSDGKWIAYTLTRYAFNCDEDLYRVDALLAYHDDGTTESADQTELPSWEPAPPESYVGLTLNLVCKSKN